MAQIDHVVVLMLENRSFDSLLGRLYPAGPDFDGLKGNESNIVNGQTLTVWTSAGGEVDSCIPTPDPAELFTDMTDQIFGPPPNAGTATMGGFASNYGTVAGADPKNVMHYYMPEQVPVISTLARSFGVSDRWHASAPNQTWPNRFFAHCGTAYGYVNNMPLHVPYMMKTVFNRLTEKHRSWRIYFHDIPQSATLAHIWSELPDHLKLFEEHFMADAMAGRLPNYSFIEPRYFACAALNRLPNDEHPPHDVMLGERLIARCYDAIRNGPGWERTLFIVTYDEHGGLFDHVKPPPAVSPDGRSEPPQNFKFDRYGVRVPAVLISPWIPAGTIVRPAGDTPFDHTSIIASLRTLFGIDPLTDRDKAAPDLVSALSLPQPSNTGPSSVPLPALPPTPNQVVDGAGQPPNHMQEALAQFTRQLPAGSATVADQLKLGELTAEMLGKEAIATVGAALTQAEKGLTRFLHGPGAG
jgi:phospholipase C